MAASADVPVVPVTISDLARWYPKGTLLPIGVPTDVVVTIHPPVYMSGPNKVRESDAIAQTYDAVRTPAPSPPLYVIFGRGSPSAAVWSIPHRGYCSSFLINYFRQNRASGRARMC